MKRSRGISKHTAPRKPKRPYHHGSLPKALLEAAEIVLRRDGLAGLSLRAIAREAGVSHTAPKGHFDDTMGVFSELAAIGHRRLINEMAAYSKDLPSGKLQRQAIARGYVNFAINNPDLFRLMARKELLDPERPALAEAIAASVRALDGIFAPFAKARASTSLDAGQAIATTAGWAYVHGLATLLIDNQLVQIAGATDVFQNPRELVDAVLGRMIIIPDPDLKS